MIDFFDPSLECCWVAESVADSSFLGCVAVLKDRRDQTAAQLRLLLVEEGARGMGLGSQLIKECVDFARAKGYQKVVLFTMSILVGARRLYERAGFELVQSDPEKDIWGNKLVNEVWELRLS
jgi:ribosomal protein S18 acetylase RimI-like enzyme